MNRFASGALVLSVAVLSASCSRKSESSALKPTAFGAAIMESSGGKQFGQAGTPLPQPVVVQVNDQQGAAVTGALVEFSAAPGVTFDPASALTDSSGQATTNVALGGMAGRYQIAASTLDKTHKKVEGKIEEISLGYQQTLGRRVNDQYCERCHNPESTRNECRITITWKLSRIRSPKETHSTSSATRTLPRSSPTEGPALNKSALMPAWGNTLRKADVQALIAYIRAVSDPPSRSTGPVYAKN